MNKYKSFNNTSLRENARLIGISPSYLSDILNGKKGCSFEVINKIIKLYKVEVEEKHTIRYKVIQEKEDSDNEINS